MRTRSIRRAWNTRRSTLLSQPFWFLGTQAINRAINQINQIQEFLETSTTEPRRTVELLKNQNIEMTQSVGILWERRKHPSRVARSKLIPIYISTFIQLIRPDVSGRSGRAGFAFCWTFASCFGRDFGTGRTGHPSWQRPLNVRQTSTHFKHRCIEVRISEVYLFALAK